MSGRAFLRLANLACAAQLVFAAGVSSAQPVQFFEDFENGVSHSPSGGTWTKFTPGHEYLLADTSHNHTPGGSKSGRAWEANPWVYNSYADFGATGDSLRASVYIFEDKNYVPPYEHNYEQVTNMFSLWGDSDSGPEAFTDYLQIGVVPWYPGGGTTYGIRTLMGDTFSVGAIDTGVQRKESEWMKLTIEVDSVALGGQVRFLIDDALVGTSQRSGADLRWVMVGGVTFTYENYWYDDISVVSVIPGDFDEDGDVDGADFVAWQTNFPLASGATLASGDGDGDADVDGADFAIWQSSFPTPAAGAASPVPEPVSLVGVLIGGLTLAAVSLRRLVGQREV